MPGAKFLEGHFNLEIEYLGPGPKKHPGEPADILVEGEYIATGQTQRGSNKAQSALVKLVLGPDGVLTGFAQYTRHRVTRPISGSWTPTFISYTEQGTGYTFKGNMKLGEEYKMDGVYYGNGVAGEWEAARFAQPWDGCLTAVDVQVASSSTLWSSCEWTRARRARVHCCVPAPTR